MHTFFSHPGLFLGLANLLWTDRHLAKAAPHLYVGAAMLIQLIGGYGSCVSIFLALH